VHVTGLNGKNPDRKIVDLRAQRREREQRSKPPRKRFDWASKGWLLLVIAALVIGAGMYALDQARNPAPSGSSAPAP
jgi:hypothetical protein